VTTDGYVSNLAGLDIDIVKRLINKHSNLRETFLEVIHAEYKDKIPGQS
jgi:hypothetical protein